MSGPQGCLRIDVTGIRTEPARYVFSLSSSAGAAKGTGIPAALGAVLLTRGEITAPGVHAPGGGGRSGADLGLAGELLPRLQVAGTGGRLPIHVSPPGPDGTLEELDLAP